MSSAQHKAKGARSSTCVSRADLRTYSNLRDLDLSQNCLQAITAGALPLSLTRLTLTCNRFVDLPALAALPSLKWLSAGANRCHSSSLLMQRGQPSPLPVL